MAELRWDQLPSRDDDAPGTVTWLAAGQHDLYLLTRTGDSTLVLTRYREPSLPLTAALADVARQAAANAIEIQSHGFGWRVAQQYENGGSEPLFPAWQHDTPGGLRVTSSGPGERLRLPRQAGRDPRRTSSQDSGHAEPEP